jgi:site-specific DNA recombinase
LLLGRIFDDRGNRMSPSHARRRGIKYRYYLSSALLQGQSDRSGSVPRVPALEVDDVVLKAVREHLGSGAAEGDRLLIEASVVRVEVQPERLLIALAPPPDSDGEQLTAATLYVPWRKPPSKQRRELLLPPGLSAEQARSIRAETRATLVTAMARGRRWLAELLHDRAITAEGIAAREGCSIRKVQMTISLAFLSPELVKAAIEGRLPRGIGVARLAGMPAQWSRQHQMLGLSIH